MSALPPITFTFDLEDHRADRSAPARYEAITREVLDFLAQRKITGTFFVVGTLAQNSPSLIEDIAGAGHEIAFHSHDHVALTKENRSRFLHESAHGKALLEQLSGQRVLGYRAPSFSLVPASAWVVDAIAELGFEYSSSVLPARNPLYGFAQAPRQPFRWPNGLLEIPAPVARLGPMTLPFLGGFYLRYLPVAVCLHCCRQVGAEQALWTYVHPYDFDVDEPFGRISGASWWVSVLLWFNRAGTRERLSRLFAQSGATAPGRPFRDLLDCEQWQRLPVFDPQTAQ